MTAKMSGAAIIPGGILIRRGGVECGLAGVGFNANVVPTKLLQRPLQPTDLADASLMCW
jgi:hypothetical protein